jgi:hypothetical protein
MGIKRTIKVISAMEAEGIIGRYAISGAFAAFYYVEATVTEDLDVLVSFDRPSGRAASGLIVLAPIFSYLQKKGYREHRREGIVIEGWPVKFLPVASQLDCRGAGQSQGDRGSDRRNGGHGKNAGSPARAHRCYRFTNRQAEGSFANHTIYRRAGGRCEPSFCRSCSARPRGIVAILLRTNWNSRPVRST